MLDLLSDFPHQLKNALDIAKDAGLEINGTISNIVFTGLGGSAIGGDVARVIISDELKVPFIVNRDYFIPGFVDSKTLLIASSYSGNTEETISAYRAAKDKKAKIIVLTSGGELSRLAQKDGFPVIKIPPGMPPRCALGYLFIPVLAAISKIGLIENKEKDIYEAMEIICVLRDKCIGQGVPLDKNEAKDLAALIVGRFCAIYGWSKSLDCVVTRWRNQFCENSKMLATSHFLPEMDHNEIMGFSHPKKLLNEMVVIFLRTKRDHIRVSERILITGSIIDKAVHRIIEVDSRGDGLVAMLCSLMYIGDFVSFYLAILNGEDPTPVDEITYLKKELAKR